MRKHAHKLLALGAIATSAVGFAVSAEAQTSPGTTTTQTVEFSRVDTDRDGNVTKREAAAAGIKELARRFNDLDKNKDGKLDQAEFAMFESYSTQPDQQQQQQRQDSPMDRQPQ